MRSIHHRLLACLFLAAITICALGPSCSTGFVNYDDPTYVTNNRHLSKGLTWAGLEWAWADFKHCMWNPFTRMSFLLDYEVFGLNPWGYHLHNVLLHIACALLVYGLIYRMTRNDWCSFLVAALFAVHPLRVESVTWVTERKDVLSTLFGLVCLWMYVRYAERTTIWRYTLVAATFVISLLAKPMLVTLPFVLLLLDYWPLGRLRLGQNVQDDGIKSYPWTKLVAEKAPLLVVALAISVVTAVTHIELGATRDRVDISLFYRTATAVLAYIQYIGMTFWPSGLAIVYPYPHSISPVKVIGAILLLSIISMVVLQQWRKRPYLIVGWLWYLGTLVPVCGLLPHTNCSYADRYMYVPHIGLFIFLCWPMVELLARRLATQWVLTGVTGMVLAACVVCTSAQVKYWRDSETLWARALELTENNHIAHVNFGSAIIADQRRIDEATAHFRRAIEIKPTSRTANLNMAIAHSVKGEPLEAEKYYRRLLDFEPDFAFAHGNLSMVLVFLGRIDEADKHLTKALDLRPDFLEARILHGVVLDRLGQVARADACFESAQKEAPDSALIYSNWGVAMLRRGKPLDAKPKFEKAIALDPNDVDALMNLGVINLQHCNLVEGERFLAKAIELRPDYGEAHFNYGVILERQGKLDQAEHHLRRATELIPDCAEAFDNLGVVLELRGELQEARKCYEQSLQMCPSLVDARCNLAGVLYQLGDIAMADAQFRDATRIDPQWLVSANQMAWSWAHHEDPNQRNIPEALRVARQVCMASKNSRPEFLCTLAACYAALKKYEEARVVAETALAIIGKSTHPQLVKVLRKNHQYYKSQCQSSGQGIVIPASYTRPGPVE